MSVVVFEGPDGAGKTTLIHALSKVVHAAGQFPTPQIIKSPAGREREWSLWNNTWVIDSAKRSGILMLDRTPEISEMVYGSIRGRCRMPGPLEAIARLREVPFMLVMCLPYNSANIQFHGSVGIIPGHFDPFGVPMGDPQRLAKAYALYEAIHFMFNRPASSSQRYHRWDWRRPNAWFPMMLSFGGYIGISTETLYDLCQYEPEHWFVDLEGNQGEKE